VARSSSGFRKALSLIIVLSCLSFLTSVGNSKSRIYYIAADEIEWNYAPSDSDLVMGHPLTEHQREWVEKDKDRIGRIYKKAVYREYTDSTFSTLKPRGAEWDHLGLLGPVIRAEVGDTIHVFFKNNSTIVTSMHPHGVFYLKDSEGAPTNDGVNAPGGSVAPGQRHHYVWPVPERAGPGPNDLSSIVWVYHGHHDHVRDLYAGLIGPMIITRKGMALEDGRPKDVDREFINLFMIWDENLSPYLNKNIANYMRKGFKPKKSDHDHDDHDDHDHHMHDMREHEEHAKEVDSGDEFDHDWDNDRFEESNKKHAINGYLFGNIADDDDEGWREGAVVFGRYG